MDFAEWVLPLYMWPSDMPHSALEPLAPSLNHGLIPRVALPSSLWTCVVAPGLILPLAVAGCPSMTSEMPHPTNSLLIWTPA